MSGPRRGNGNVSPHEFPPALRTPRSEPAGLPGHSWICDHDPDGKRGMSERLLRSFAS